MSEINLIESVHPDSEGKDETYFAYSIQPFYEKNQLFFSLFEAHLFLFLHLPSCYPSAGPAVLLPYDGLYKNPAPFPTPAPASAVRCLLLSGLSPQHLLFHEASSTAKFMP
jgi:hypothetical protein